MVILMLFIRSVTKVQEDQIANTKFYCTDNWDTYNFGIKDPNRGEIRKRKVQDIEGCKS